MSLLGSLEIGKKSMSNAQQAQSTTGHNIANVDTEGFSRQEIDQVTAAPAVAGHGQGADIRSVRRIQDGFTKEKVVGEQSQVGSWNTKEKILTEAESIFTDLEGNKLRNALDEFWSSWGTLAHEPESSPMRKALVAKSEALAERFHIFHGRLNGMRDTINGRISARILEANQLAQQIAQANKQVEQTENRGMNANDARDMRERLLQQLSEIIEVRWAENNRGTLDVQIKNGQSIVLGRESYDLTPMKQASKQGDVQIGLKGPTGLVTDVTHIIGGGVVKELVDQRDGNIAEFAGNIDLMAKELVFRVNAIHSGGTGIKAAKVEETSAYSLNDEARNQPLPFLKSGSFGISLLGLDGMTERNINIQVEAGKDTVESLVEKINTAAGAYEDEGVKPAEGEAVDGAAPVAPKKQLKAQTPFKAVINPEGSVSLMADMGRKFYFDGDDTNFNAVMGFNSFFHGVNGAADIAVNQDLVEDEMKVAAGYGLIPSDNRVATQIADMQRAAVLSDGTQSFDEFYNGQTTTIGLKVQDAQKGAKSHGQMLDQYEALRDSVSAVNLDEEMANMVKYQRAYEASAKYLSTVDEMTQSVINM